MYLQLIELLSELNHVHLICCTTARSTAVRAIRSRGYCFCCFCDMQMFTISMITKKKTIVLKTVEMENYTYGLGNR